MSSITITDLLAEPNITDEDYANWEVVRSTEIVPRKMVEMIIEHLYEQMNACAEGGYADYVLHNSVKYAESLLKQFEEGEE